MAKKRSKKIEKETRRLMESITDLVKKKGDRYKFKTKNKKVVRKIKKTCPHWIYNKKGKEVPALREDGNDWVCRICGERFPINPMAPEEYDAMVKNMVSYVNQIQFWAVKLGGDAEDTKMFLELRKLLPRYAKVSKQVLKRINRRQQYEENRKNSDMANFNSYSAFHYNP